MTAESSIVRIDATYGLTVQVGDKVRPGDALCEASGTTKACLCPVRGVIESIRFDGENHEFVISIAPGP